MLTAIKEILEQKVDQVAVLEEQHLGLQSALYINPIHLVAVCEVLRETEGLYFDFLSNITAVDYHPENYFEVVYHLSSIPYQKELVLKVRLENDRQQENLPELPSVSSIWRTADWHEREAFDLMGIFFTEHPDLRRILLPDDWEGFPLRKDYVDPETYHNIPIK